MNDFRIILENTFKFKEGKLYLMLLREDGRFGVEVVNREKTFGRRFAKDKAEADLLFDLTSKKLYKYKKKDDAESALKRCFSLKSIDTLKFMLFVDDNTISQADIMEMRSSIEFRTRVKIDYRKNKKEENALTIYIYESFKHKKPFGVLVGTREAKDLRFELL